jgi:hypothetical protein
MERTRRYPGGKDYRLRDDVDDPRDLRDGERMKILRDRERLRVPMMMADGVNLYDHQPGPHRVKDRALLDAKEAAYRLREFEDSIAWMPPHMRPRPDAAPPLTRDHADAQQIFDERFVENDLAATTRAYQMRDWEDTNAWRGRDWLANNRLPHLE